MQCSAQTCGYPQDIVLDTLLDGALIRLGRVHGGHDEVNVARALHRLEGGRQVINPDAVGNRIAHEIWSQEAVICSVEGCITLKCELSGLRYRYLG